MTRRVTDDRHRVHSPLAAALRQSGLIPDESAGRRCRRCMELKPLVAFPRHKGARFRHNTCGACRAEAKRHEWHLRKPVGTDFDAAAGKLPGCQGCGRPEAATHHLEHAFQPGRLLWLCGTCYQAHHQELQRLAAEVVDD
jgi:hypothetical protein